MLCVGSVTSKSSRKAEQEELHYEAAPQQILRKSPTASDPPSPTFKTFSQFPPLSRNSTCLFNVVLEFFFICVLCCYFGRTFIVHLIYLGAITIQSLVNAIHPVPLLSTEHVAASSTITKLASRPLLLLSTRLQGRCHSGRHRA